MGQKSKLKVKISLCTAIITIVIMLLFAVVNTYLNKNQVVIDEITAYGVEKNNYNSGTSGDATYSIYEEEPFEEEYSIGAFLPYSQTFGNRSYGSGFTSVELNSNSQYVYTGTNRTKEADVYRDVYDGFQMGTTTYDYRTYLWIEEGDYYKVIDNEVGQYTVSNDEPTVIGIEFHFYKSGTLATNNPVEVAVKGIGSFLDLDSYEGYKFVRGVDNDTGIYLSKDTSVSSASAITETLPFTTSTTDAWFGTYVSMGIDVKADQILYYEFESSPDAPMQINYYGIQARGSFISSQTNKITYHIIGDVPDGIGYQEQSIYVATAGTYTIQNQILLEGYTFTGWNLGSIGGTNVSGQTISPITSDLDLYGQFAMNISVEKVWEDNNNQDGIRPPNVTVTLYNNGVSTNKTVVLNSLNNWSGKFDNLEMSDNYTLVETPITGYTPTITEKSTNGYVITNTHIPETVNMQVEKKWEDNENSKGHRPDSVTVQLTENGVEVEGKIAELVERDGWRYTFEDLPKYEAGQEIEYNIIESETEDGDLEYYEEEPIIEKTDETTIQITNKYREMDTNVQSEIKKTGTAEIKSSKDKVQYNVSYTATIDEYIGDVELVIVDYLPYGIDLDNSDIANGKYDEENHTITWTENIGHVNTYKGGTKEINIAKDITVVFNNLDATKENMTNRVTGTINLYETGKTSTVEDTYDTKINIEGEVITHYYIEGTEEKLSKDKIITGKVNSQYTTVPADDIPANYELVEMPKNYTGTIVEGQTVVTYYYRLKTPDIINPTITKESSIEKVIDKNKLIDYTINYTVTIDKYIGNATVTIVDQLPYEIDTSKTYDLDGGKYSNAEKTITWTETINNIDTFANNSTQEINITKEITLVYKDIDVTQANVTNKVTGTVKLETPEKEETVEDTEEIPTEYLIDITVNKKWNDAEDKYQKRPKEITIQLKQGEEVIAEKVVTKENNWECTFADLPKYDVDGQEIIYTIDEKQTQEEAKYYTKEIGELTNKEGTTNEKEGTITNNMTHLPGKVIVRYKDINTGKEILSSITDEGIVGEKFDISKYKQEIPGYVLVEEPEELTGTYAEEMQEKVYYYAYISAGVVEKHIDVITGELLYNEVHEGNEGDPYNIPSREFEGYDLLEVDEEGNSMLPTNAEGKMTIEAIEVKYYYIKKATVRVEYVDIDTGEKLTEDEIINGHEKDKYTTESKEIDGYHLIEIPENAEGIMEITENEDGTYNTETKVTYYYVKIAGGVEEKHIDIYDGNILAQEEHEGNVGDSYSIPSREFEGYDLVEIDAEGNSMLPENAEGTMTEEKIEVIYYYKRKTNVEIQYLEKDTENQLSENEIIEGYVGDQYETEPKEIPYYRLVESTENTEGEMTKEKIIVTYYYEKQKFNLGIDKWISNVEIDGVSQIAQNYNTKDQIYKLDIHRTKVKTADVKITYTIRITNTGEIEGTAEEITEIIPEGYSFNKEDNSIDWKENNGILTTDELKDEMIQPGEYKEIEIVLRWNKGDANLGQKNNTVKINSFNNPAGFEDVDEEDNIDTSEMLLSIATGTDSIAKNIVVGILEILIIGTLVALLIYQKRNSK